MSGSSDVFADELTPLALYDLVIADDDAAGPQADSPEGPGQLIAGRYIIKSLLGEGGAGRVWAAEQVEPVRRDVAVKIIRPGLVTKPVSARFSREHQMLARMEHPNIAAVFDAGELPDGRTYFVMEIVAGAPMTSWCRKHNLPVRERLRTFLQACHAIHHAHQKGVLHRDLKPSNVMVTQVDGRPLVKVIDFGIAKALGGELLFGEEQTLRGIIMGTPRYMSPEQAGLTGLELDARMDVYALGVLLYELLTGSTPIPDQDEKDQPLPELLERVRHTEVEAPSRRVMRLGHRPQGRALARELHGDLDWITLRALQKERAQRYSSAEALAEDIERCLRDEPVFAGPPGLTYRMKKWLIRQRHALVMIAAIAVSLAGGLAATLWALEREEAQRQDALRLRAVASNESDLAKVVSNQLEDLLTNARKHVQAGMNTQILRNLADECAAGMPRFAGQPKTEVRLAGQLAQLYEALEEPSRALPWYRRVWELTRDREGERSPASLGALYDASWRLIPYDASKAADMLRQVIEGYESIQPATAENRAQALLARKELARALSRAGRHEEAVALMATVMKEKGESDPMAASAWLRDQAHILRSSGRNDEARAVLRHAVDLVPPDQRNSGQYAYLLASIAYFDGSPEDQVRALQASAEGLRRLEAEKVGGPQLLNALISYVALACRVPGCPGGEQAARRALAIAQSGGQESRLADAWIAISECLRVNGRLVDSEQAVRDAIQEVSRTQAEKWRVLELHRRLGDLLTARGAFEDALEQYEFAMDGWFARTTTGRPREKERLIFTSFIEFWRAAAAARSPLADARQLADWERKLENWDNDRGGLWQAQAREAPPGRQSLP